MGFATGGNSGEAGRPSNGHARGPQKRMVCDGPGRRKAWVPFIFQEEQQGQTRACSFSEKKQSIVEAISEMLPRSTNNKHGVCAQEHALLGALCGSSNCTCTHVHTRCAPLAIIWPGIRLHIQKRFNGQHSHETSRSIS